MSSFMPAHAPRESAGSRRPRAGLPCRPRARESGLACHGPRGWRRSRRALLPGPADELCWCPRLTVIGRSVFSRSVRHGTPSTVVSSWMPPESVSTSRRRPAAAGSRGSRAARSAAGRERRVLARARAASRRARVRGWTGKTTGSRAPIARRRVGAARQASPGRRRSTGRCSVTQRVARAAQPEVARSASRVARRRHARAACRSSRCRRSAMRSASDALAAQVLVARRLGGVRASSVSASVTTRLISSGIVRSKLRRPASTWATGTPSFGRRRARRRAWSSRRRRRPRRRAPCSSDDRLEARSSPRPSARRASPSRPRG